MEVLLKKRFNGDGNSGAGEYKVWKRWARAALEVKKVSGMPPKALGPWMYTLLDGQAASALECGEELVLRELDHRLPVKVAADRMGRGHGGEIMKKTRQRRRCTGRSRLAFTRLQTEGITCRQKPDAASFCVDVDSGAWVEQRPCLRHAEAGILVRYPRRSERRLLVVHRTGGRTELLVWMNWKTELRMSLRITWTSEVAWSLSAKLRPSRVLWNPKRKAMQLKFLRPGNKPERP